MQLDSRSLQEEHAECCCLCETPVKTSGGSSRRNQGPLDELHNPKPKLDMQPAPLGGRGNVSGNMLETLGTRKTCGDYSMHGEGPSPGWYRGHLRSCHRSNILEPSIWIPLLCSPLSTCIPKRL